MYNSFQTGVTEMKKNSFFAVLAAVLVMAVTLSFLVLPSFASRKLGDVDGDGDITSGDARLALRASVKLENLDAEATLAADVDDDTFITSADARLILRASVKLESLPDVSVNVPEEPTAEQPSDPEPTEPTATDTDPEPTSGEPVSEPTSDPTTEPTSEPTTELIPPAADNEYDILRSGTYYMRGYTVENGTKSELEIARTPTSLYLGSTFDNIKIAIMTIGDKVYLVNPNKNTYLDLNNEIIKGEMRLLGIEINDFTNTTSFDFSFFPSLEEATRCEEVPGGYVKYVFEAPDGAINVVMDGKTLISLENARNGSVYRIDFISVSSEVPSTKRDKKDLQQQTQLIFAASLV